MNKIKIIIVFDQSSWGGADTHLNNLLYTWPNIEDEIHIYYNSYNKGITRVKNHLENIKFIKFFKYDIKIVNFFEKINRIKFIKILNLFFIPLRLRIMRNYFKKVFNENKYDCLVSNNGGYPASYACLAAVLEAKINNIESVNMLVHHQAKKPHFLYKNFRNNLDNQVANSLNKLIAVSNATMDELGKNSLILNKISKDKKIIINNGINLEHNSTHKINLSKYFLNQKNFIVGTLGRIESYKGQADLIYAYMKLSNNLKQKFNVAIIGDGETKEINRLKKIIDSNSINENVKMLGYIEGDGRDIISGLDLLVFPTRTWEGWGLVALEAMAEGVPLISSRVGATPEFINLKNGYLYEPGSIEELAFALTDFFENSNKWKKKALVAKKFVEKYDSKFISRKFRDTIIHN